MERRSKRKIETKNNEDKTSSKTTSDGNNVDQGKIISRRSPRKFADNVNPTTSNLLVDVDEDVLSTSNELHVEILATDVQVTGSVTRSGRKVKPTNVKPIEKPTKRKMVKKTPEKAIMEKSEPILEQIDMDKEKNLKLEIAKKSKGSYQCYECQETFKTFPDLCKHLFRHPVSNPRLCENCGAGFHRLDHFKSHEGRKTCMCTEMPYECDQCSQGFTSKYLLDFHMEEHKTNEVIQCGYCESYFQNGSKFLKHLSPGKACFQNIKKDTGMPQNVQKSNPAYVCNVCDRKFQSASYLYLHMDTHGKSDVFLCTNCGVGFCEMDEKSITEHKKAHEEMSYDVNMQCDVCDEYLTDKDLLIKHKKCHLGVDYFDCHLCQDRFTDGSSLVKHLDDPDVTCKLTDELKEKIASTKNTADEDFEKDDEMENVNHVTDPNENDTKEICRIPGEKMFSEPLENIQNEVMDYGAHRSCISLFVTKTVKLAYQQEADIFKCDTCKETFKTYQHLYYHLHQHKYSHIHICMACGIGMEKMADFEDHKFMHFEEKVEMPYECSICEERFLHADLITLHHEVVHEGKELLYCGRCSIGFDERKKFIEHYDSHHGRISGLNKPTGKKDGLASDKDVCKFCSYSGRQHVIHHHVRTKHRLLCHACEKTLETFRLLKDHVKQHPEEYPYRCGLCLDTYNDIKELVHHINIHKVKEQDWFVCRICSEKMLSKDNFEIHKKTHICEHCQLVIKSMEHLDSHKEKCSSFSNPNYKYIRVCPYCAQGFRSIAQYKCHFSCHVKKGNFTCEICPMTIFFTEIDLQRHYNKWRHKSKVNIQNSEKLEKDADLNEDCQADSDAEEFSLEMEMSDTENEKIPSDSQKVDESNTSIMNLLEVTIAGQSLSNDKNLAIETPGSKDKSEQNRVSTILMSTATLENLKTYQQLITAAKTSKSELDTASVMKLLQETKEIQDKNSLEKDDNVPSEKEKQTTLSKKKDNKNKSPKAVDTGNSAAKAKDTCKQKTSKPPTPAVRPVTTSGRKIKRPAFFDELSDQHEKKRAKVSVRPFDIKQEPVETNRDNPEPEPTTGTNEKHGTEELDVNLQNTLDVKGQAYKEGIDSSSEDKTNKQLPDIDMTTNINSSVKLVSKKRKLAPQSKTVSSQNHYEKGVKSMAKNSGENGNVEMDTSEITPQKSDRRRGAKIPRLSDACTPLRKSGRTKTESTKLKLAKESINFLAEKTKTKKEDVQIKQEVVDNSEEILKLKKNKSSVSAGKKGFISDSTKSEESSDNEDKETDSTSNQKTSEPILIDTFINADKKVFECTHCGLSFSTYILLITHISTHHTGEYVYFCYTCGQGIGCQKSQTSKFEKLHSELHEKNLSDFPFVCDRPSCEKHFKDKELMVLHQRTEHDDKSLLQCDLCQKELLYFRFLVIHFKKCFMKHYMKESSYKEQMVSSTGNKDETKCSENENTQASKEKPDITHGTDRSEGRNGSQLKKKGEEFIKQLLSIHELKKYGISKTTLTPHNSDGIFFCEVCGEHSADYTEFYNHLKQHAGRSPSICLACGRGINNSSHNKIKWNKLHKKHENLPFTCETCQCTFAKQELLYMHETSEHNGKGLFICSHCGKDFHLASMYAFHIDLSKKCGRLKKDSLLNKSKINEMVKNDFGTDLGAKSHSKSEIVESKTRKKLVLRFPVKVKLTGDERRYIQKQNHERLKNKFQKARKVLQAKKTEIASSNGIKCYICHRFFKFGQFLCEHGRSFTYHKASVCDQCGRIFRSRYALLMHLKRKHNGIQRKSYTCQICKTKFAIPMDLHLHLSKVHKIQQSTDGEINQDDHAYIPSMVNDDSESQRYMSDLNPSDNRSSNPNDYITEQNDQLACSICGYIVKTKCKPQQVLRNHIIRKHIGEKKLFCSICNYACVFPVDLRTHTDYCHSGKQTCKICQKILGSKRGLRLHMERNHQESFVLEMKFECRFCGDRFGYIKELKSHEHEKHSDVKYQCDICRNILTNELGLRRHFQKVHGIEREKAYEKVKKVIFTPSKNGTAPNVNKDGTTETVEAADFIQKYLLESTPKTASTKAKDGQSGCEEDISEVVENSVSHANEKGDNINDNIIKKEMDDDDDDVTSDEFRLCHICGALQLDKASLSAHILMVHEKPIWICKICGSTKQSKAKATKHRQDCHKAIRSNVLCFTRSVGIPTGAKPTNEEMSVSIQKIINDEMAKTCNEKTGKNTVNDYGKSADDKMMDENTPKSDDDNNDVEEQVQIRGQSLSSPVQKLLTAFENVTDNAKSFTANVSSNNVKKAGEEIDDCVHVLNDLDMMNEDGLYTATRLELSPMKKLNKYDSLGMESTTLSTSSSLESRLMAENSGLINFTKIEPPNEESDNETLIHKEGDKLEAEMEKSDAGGVVPCQRNIIQKDFTQNEIDIASSLLKLEPPVETGSISREYSDTMVMEGPVVIAYLQTGNIDGSTEGDIVDATNNEPTNSLMCENLTIVPLDRNTSASDVQSAFIENVDIQNEITIETTGNLASLCHKVAFDSAVSKSVKKRSRTEKVTILTVVEDKPESEEKQSGQSSSTIVVSAKESNQDSNNSSVEPSSDSNKILEQSSEAQTSPQPTVQSVKTEPGINAESKKSETDSSTEKRKKAESTEDDDMKTKNKAEGKTSNLINTECELGNIKLPNEKFTADDKIHQVINVPGRLNTPFQAVVKLPDDTEEIQNTVVNLPGSVQSVDLTVANMDTDDEDVYLLFFI